VIHKSRAHDKRDADAPHVESSDFLATLLERLNKAIDRAEEADRAKNRFFLTLVVEF
jgi:hypothetical protein